jgi:hypothetical protein
MRSRPGLQDFTSSRSMVAKESEESLVGAIEDRARHRGSRRLYRASRYYEQLGWSIIDRIDWKGFPTAPMAGELQAEIERDSSFCAMSARGRLDQDGSSPAEGGGISAVPMSSGLCTGFH